VEEVRPKRIEVHVVRAPATAEGEQEAAGEGGRIDAMREHGHVDSAFAE
jgi:hypothetical protein